MILIHLQIGRNIRDNQQQSRKKQKQAGRKCNSLPRKDPCNLSRRRAEHKMIDTRPRILVNSLKPYFNLFTRILPIKRHITPPGAERTVVDKALPDFRFIAKLPVHIDPVAVQMLHIRRRAVAHLPSLVKSCISFR